MTLYPEILRSFFPAPKPSITVSSSQKSWPRMLLLNQSFAGIAKPCGKPTAPVGATSVAYSLLETATGTPPCSSFNSKCVDTIQIGGHRACEGDGLFIVLDRERWSVGVIPRPIT